MLEEEDLMSQLTDLQERLRQLEEKSKSKKPVSRHGHTEKLYTGLSGFYLEFLADVNDEVYQDTKKQLDTLLTDPEYTNQLNSLDLGRAILHYYRSTGNIILWVANQNSLLFGPARRGIKEAQPGEIFQTPLAKLTKHAAVDDINTNASKIRHIIQFDNFIAEEKRKIAINKLQRQLQFLQPPKKKR